MRMRLSLHQDITRGSGLEPSACDVCREVPECDGTPCESPGSMPHNIRPYRAGGTWRGTNASIQTRKVDVDVTHPADSVGDAREGPRRLVYDLTVDKNSPPNDSESSTRKNGETSVGSSRCSTRFFWSRSLQSLPSPTHMLSICL